MNPLVLWLHIAAHAAKLTGRAIARKWPWLLVAPALSLVVDLLAAPLSALGGPMVGGILVGLVFAAAVSLALYVGRGIIEQRRMDLGDLQTGLMAFFGDVLNVMFVVWIVRLVSAYVPPLLLLLGLALAVLPVFEIVALAPVGGLGAFPAAWAFFRRDFGPWLAGQLPVVALVVSWFLVRAAALHALEQSDVTGFVLRVASLGSGLVLWLLLFVAFIYRGVLFLTLDGTSPHGRAAKFGGR